MKKPSSDGVKRFSIFVATLGAMAVILVGVSMMAGEAKQADMNKEVVSHSDCVVTDKSREPNRNGREYDTYKIATSCGDFVTDSDLFESIYENETYDLTATLGNWANKPTILSITAEPSSANY